MIHHLTQDFIAKAGKDASKIAQAKTESFDKISSKDKDILLYKLSIIAGLIPENMSYDKK